MDDFNRFTRAFISDYTLGLTFSMSDKLVFLGFERFDLCNPRLTDYVVRVITDLLDTSEFFLTTSYDSDTKIYEVGISDRCARETVVNLIALTYESALLMTLTWCVCNCERSKQRYEEAVARSREGV